MLSRWWPSSLAGRIMLVLLAAVAAEFAGAAVIYERADLFRTDDSRFRRVADRLILADRLLSAAPEPDRPRVADDLSTPDLTLGWMRDVGPPLRSPPKGDAGALQAQLATAPFVMGHMVTVTEQPSAGGERIFSGTVHRPPSGGVVTFRLREDEHASPLVVQALINASSIAVFVLLAALLAVRSLAGPLNELTRSVDAFGGETPRPVPENGPPDVSRLARAFNAMQQRIIRLIEDRTRSLAAISHDLRTPLSRLRLRAGFLSDDELQREFEEDIGEIEALIDSILTFVGETRDGEAPQRVDVATLLATLAHSSADLGADVRYDGPDQAEAILRHLLLKRAVSNLIGNALTYAGMARIALEVGPTHLTIRVEDHGPGVPDAELGRLAEPFYRLDVARQRNTAGAGLGLAIVKQIVARENGVLRLSNRPGGGFQAAMVLPREAGSPAGG